MQLPLGFEWNLFLIMLFRYKLLTFWKYFDFGNVLDSELVRFWICLGKWPTSFKLESLKCPSKNPYLSDLLSDVKTQALFFLHEMFFILPV